MRNIFLAISVIILTPTVALAQNQSNGHSIVISDDRVDSLLQLHINHNAAFPAFPGYRVQILMASGNDALDVIDQVKVKFEKNYPDINVYLTFGEPNYRLRAGDFRTRLEAENFLQKIQKKYPGAWVTQDNINFPDM